MTYGIITHYMVHNHGALLQLTALIKVLAKKGIDARALQFDKNYDFLGIELKSKYNISVKSVGVYLKYLHQEGLRKTWYNIKKRNLLSDYKSQNKLIGEYYSSINHLDAVIVGSDEVFALHTGPTPVFFGHALPTENVFSYGGSFGPTTVEDVKLYHCEAFVASGLKAMKGVSVRDMNSWNVVEALTGIEPTIVCDPVILYGFQQEVAQLNKPDIPPYLLVYAYDNRMNDQIEVEAIKAYAKKHNLKTLSPGFYHEWCDYNVNVDPIELLGYFKYADNIITDTFHGSVMSIITNSSFMVKTRESNYNKLYSLLSEYQLSDRIITNLNTMEDVSCKYVNWKIVNEEIGKRRKEAMLFLDRIVEMCK
ncbi:MAG TPA: polysaccharide pyruvyl transferase family protein [Candidatus Merdenecus merdavium]|nr:polysaccharide pyruvyl transferase family protein [Candidatus Merdenecus merdavium]